jgi:putative hemolysin
MKCEILYKIENEKIKNNILKLRNLSFKEAYNKPIKDEWSKYDENSYHFVIFHDDVIIGYYRLRNFNKNINDTLASKMFDLENFSYPMFSELSRACVDPSYRDGGAISLLWTNISSFLLTNNIKYCIGCTSTKNNIFEINNTFSWILSKNLIFKDLILPKYKIEINEKINEDDIKKKQVTTLIRAYGKQGALFSPWPSYDEEWNTIDFFTVFNVSDLTKKFSKMG